MKYVFWWLSVIVPVTLISITFYAVSQQTYREGLNDPQIQIAEDAAALLAGGAMPAEAMPLVAGEAGARTPTVDLSRSLAPWVAVFDASGTPLEASGYLGNQSLRLPQGVFDTDTWLAHTNGRYYNQALLPETRFTWQPEEDVRQAVVLVQTPDKKYFVAAGRNMREVEQRIEHEGEIVFVGWGVTVLAVTLLQLLYVFFVRGSARLGSRRN